MTTTRPISKSDFHEPESSPVGMRLRALAALLTLLEDLNFDALELDYSDIATRFGMSNENVRRQWMMIALDAAGREVIEAQDALRALFRQVQRKPTAAATQ
jgi:hypothetical protein